MISLDVAYWRCSQQCADELKAQEVAIITVSVTTYVRANAREAPIILGLWFMVFDKTYRCSDMIWMRHTLFSSVWNGLTTISHELDGWPRLRVTQIILIGGDSKSLICKCATVLAAASMLEASRSRLELADVNSRLGVDGHPNRCMKVIAISQAWLHVVMSDDLTHKYGDYDTSTPACSARARKHTSKKSKIRTSSIALISHNFRNLAPLLLLLFAIR